jgi:hypothetical protein
LKNFKDIEIERANLDYTYSYKRKPLKYAWKCAEFKLKKFDKILEVLKKVFVLEKFSKKNRDEVFELVKFLVKEMDESNFWLSESIGIFNKTNDVFLYFNSMLVYDEYRKKIISDADILLVTTKKKESLLKLLPNNNGTIFTDLIFAKKEFY